ncbi:hypothetical protein O6H91_01G175200 [Diphasiastrum complanatum]|uniref:Uncharacterized protein n=2 Tax=Diphasiastrum complanatum TaxID=34168 RepID=A0ACC2EZ20_DIPCM|nr:hypothetical protein O6H91_01G175200 [Diphasiastrum complanatum]
MVCSCVLRSLGLWRQHSDDARKRLLLLCGYVFLTQFTPSEPYLVPYLTQDKHFSNEEVATHIFPVSVYFMLLFTLLAAPACGLLSYRGVIIIGTFGKLGTFVMILLGKSLLSMQLAQTSATQATSMVSFVIAAELGQFLVYKHVPLGDLYNITIVMVGVACLVVFMLPKGPSKRKDKYDILSSSSSNIGRPFMINLFSSHQRLHEIMRETWKGQGLQLLSFWWAFQIAGTAMVVNYATNVFDAINPLSTYNGHVLAAAQGVACIAALVAVPISNVSVESGSLLFASGSALTGSFCFLMAWSKSLWVAYPAYVINIGVNQLLACLLYVQCAKTLSNGQYALLFSLNTLAGYIVQAMFQAIMETFSLSIFYQFYFLAIHFLSLAIIFALLCLLYSWRTSKISLVGPSQHHLPDENAQERDEFMEGEDGQALP